MKEKVHKITSKLHSSAEYKNFLRKQKGLAFASNAQKMQFQNELSFFFQPHIGSDVETA